MPSARSSAAAGRAARPAGDYARRSSTARARRPAPAAPWTRIRWDRVGRTGLVIVLTVVAGLYIQQAIQYVTTRIEAGHQQASVHRLARANAALRRQQQSLSNPVTIKNDARKLGMVQAGERPYVVMGLPKH